MRHHLAPLFLLALGACAPRESSVNTTPASVTLTAPPPASASTQAAAKPQVATLPIAVVGDRLELGKTVTFVTNSSDLTTDPDNEQILATVVDYLTHHPEVTKLRVEVHSDSMGASEYNMRMSQSRADHFAGTLVDRGIATERLHPIGHGSTRPIAPNQTADGRAKNRRTEFHVEELNGTPLGSRPAPN